MNEYFVSAILDCGVADLSILNGVEYEYEDIIAEAKGYGEMLTLGSLFHATMNLGLYDLDSAIENRVDELLGSIMSQEEIDELEQIKKLDVYDDFEIFFNYLDSHIWAKNNKEIYQKYFSKEIDDFENMTGFCIGF